MMAVADEVYVSVHVEVNPEEMASVDTDDPKTLKSAVRQVLTKCHSWKGYLHQ